jgi:ABC-type multidrug transport system fused ATPase/permease subunit
MQLEKELDRAGKDVPGTPTVDKSGLPKTWFGYLWKIEPKLCLASAFMQLAWSSCTILAAYYFINEMTANRNSQNFDQQRGLELCFGYLGTITAIAVTFQLKNLWVGQMGANMKSRLSARVAEHALLRGSISSADKSLALVLASRDAHNICEGVKCVWQLPAAIAEGIVIVALVIWRSGSISGGIAAGLLIGGFIALFYMSLYMTALKQELSVVQDKQVSLFYEVLANIRPFRFYGWDRYFLDRLNNLTDALIPIHNKILILKALNVTAVVCFPCVASFILFLVIFYTTGSMSTPSNTITLLSLLNTFRYPLLNLPASLRAISSANNSYARMREYFNKDVHEDTRSAASVPGAVEVNNLPVGPEGSVLKSLHIQPGSLVILQGPVKSYKSTMIKTLAGHYSIPSTASVRIGGSVSYAPQSPWMCQTTIQDNIVSSEPFDEKRYKEILHACALTQDLSVMPLGDQSPVAEKGISLSGGQRQRVALARATYRRADIYLLDNPISALDDATQEFIWDNLIEGLLKNATVIVASSRSVRSCSSILHLSVKGLEGEPVQISGWVNSHMSDPRPSRYTPGSSALDGSNQAHPISRRASISSVEAPVRHSSRRQTLDDAAMQDVSNEVKLFDEYVSTRARGMSIRSPRGAPLSAIVEISGAGTEMQAQTSSDKIMSEPQTFLEIMEQKREAAGITSSKHALGSRRVSYASVLEAEEDSIEAQPLVQKRSDSVPDMLTAKSIPEPKSHGKSAFRSWLQFCGLSKPFVGFLIFLYLFNPAPRIWFDQWIAFWASETFSSDNQFNIDILAISLCGFVGCRVVHFLMAFYIAAASERNMRKAICKTVINAPMSFFMTENLGPLVGVFSRDMAIIGDELMQDAHMGALYITFNFAATINVCWVFPPFAAVGFVIFAILFWVQRQYSQKMFHIRLEFQKAQDDVFRTLYDCLEGLEILRSARCEQWAIDNLAETFSNNRIAIVAVEKTNNWLAQRADTPSIILCFLMVIVVNYVDDVPVAARGIIIGNSLPMLVLFTWSMKLIGNVQFLLNSVHRIQSYVDRVAPEEKGGVKLPKDFPKSGVIDFQKLSLRYSASLPLALDGVSLKLPHASKVGVVGRTGSGKSTLLVALFRLIQPCGGTLIVDGQSVNNVTVDALRQQLSIIPQDPAMFQGTLRFNLDPFHEYTDQQVRTAINQVGLSETRDMHSTVEVSGDDWSLGEKQLVSS